MIEKINQYLEEAKGFVATTMDEIEAFRIKYMGKKGLVNDLFLEFKNVPRENKKDVGQKLNELKVSIQDKINSLKENLEDTADANSGIDMSASGDPVKLGTRHPISIVRNEIIDIFKRLGFTISEGPEIEDDWHVFSALNFPEEHPARDMQDTFFIEMHPDILLRTHTSSVQVRVMENSQPPIRTK